jgi:hypothetical protein
VWPDDDVSEDKVRSDVGVGASVSPRTLRAASTRLAGLDYYPGVPPNE